MALVETVTTKFRGAERLKNSVNGNPRWKLLTDDGTFITTADSSVGYEVSNHTGRPEHSPHSWIGRSVVLTLTRAGRVTMWERRF